VALYRMAGSEHLFWRPVIIYFALFALYYNSSLASLTRPSYADLSQVELVNTPDGPFNMSQHTAPPMYLDVHNACH